MSKGPAKIIIEGIEYTNSKSIALALSEYPQFVGPKEDHRFTTVISAKWGNFRDFPWGKGLIDFAPSEEKQVMKKYGTWAHLIELQGYYNWIIDRFHISAQCYQKQCNDHVCEFKWLEERFLKLGFHLVHVTQNSEAIERAIENQKIDNSKNRLEQIIKEQDLLRTIASKSILPKIELDISEMGVQEAVENITDWYEEVYSYTEVDNPETDKIFLPSCS